jgi:hypothetical protein
MDSERPVRIWLWGHAIAYDVAWTEGPTGPELTDLRLVPLIPSRSIGKRDMMRINPERLARAASSAGQTDKQRFVDDTTRALRAEFGDDVEIRSVDGPGRTSAPKGIQGPKRSPGRPARTHEFYVRVAQVANEAQAQGDSRIGIWRYVQECARHWPDVNPDIKQSTVEKWLREARKLTDPRTGEPLYSGPRSRSKTQYREGDSVQ